MAIEVNKQWLNCKADFKLITLSNSLSFYEDFKGTIPALFVHNGFKDTCYYKLGNITESVKCDKKNETPRKELIAEATARYILEHSNLFPKEYNDIHGRELFAHIKLQEEMCSYIPDPGPASGITTVVTVVGIGTVCLLGYKFYNYINHGGAHE